MASLKSLLNNSAAGDLFLSASSDSSNSRSLKNALVGTEITIAVNWSGGGQIKPGLYPQSDMDIASVLTDHVTI